MEQIDRIEKIFRMLGSTHDGEIVNAVNSIRKTLVAQNKGFNDLADFLFHNVSQGSTRSSAWDDIFKREYRRQQQSKTHKISEYVKMCEYLIDMPTKMTNWESTFISDVYNSQLLEGRTLSAKQDEWIWKVYNKYYKEKARR